VWTLIVASGPSLTRSDCDALRGKVDQCIAVNCAIFVCPWADILYAADGKWWRHYGKDVAWFKGERASMTYRKPGVTHYRPKLFPRTGGNSGHQALTMAVERGAKHVALLGFDHKEGPGGKKHYHGDHPDGLGNANSLPNWAGRMNHTAIEIAAMGVEVVNLTRDTALRCYPRMTVEDFVKGLA